MCLYNGALALVVYVFSMVILSVKLISLPLCRIMVSFNNFVLKFILSTISLVNPCSLSISINMEYLFFFFLGFFTFGPVMVSKQLNSSPLTRMDRTWAPVLILAAALPNQLPSCGLGKQLRMAQRLWNLHPHGRPGGNVWLLASSWHSYSHCDHLGSESSDRRSSSLLLLSLYMTLEYK